MLHPGEKEIVQEVSGMTIDTLIYMCDLLKQNRDQADQKVKEAQAKRRLAREEIKKHILPAALPTVRQLNLI